MPYIHNVDHNVAVELASLVNAEAGQVVSKTLVQNGHVGLTLFSFAAGEAISSHESRGDALVMVLEGTANLTVGDDEYTVKAGESFVMPANIPHAVSAVDDMKMFLIVVFPKQQ